jgi:hypothetical protein
VLNRARAFQFHQTSFTAPALSHAPLARMSQRRHGHSRRNPSVDIPKYQPQKQLSSEEQAVHERQRNLGQISDYDSENAGYTSELIMKPPPLQRTTDELNDIVVRRHHPEVARVLAVAPYAVIYEFETIPEPAWEKKDIEGSLFICQLTSGSYGEDRYAAIVLNRRGLKNFNAPLIEVENGGVEVTDPYVIITFIEEGKQKIYGVFVFSEGPGTSTEHSRTYSGELMVTLANQAGISRKAAELAAAEAQERHTKAHLQDAGASLEDQNMAGEDMGRQINLHQLFGQQRAQDAGYSARSHHTDESTRMPTTAQFGTSHIPQPTPPAPALASSQDQSQKLMDLFRNAGPASHQPPQRDNALGQLFEGKSIPQQASQQSQQYTPQHTLPPSSQPNVLADLFRRSGFPAQ